MKYAARRPARPPVHVRPSRPVEPSPFAGNVAGTAPDRPVDRTPPAPTQSWTARWGSAAIDDTHEVAGEIGRSNCGLGA